MNILIAKVIVQSFIDENELSLVKDNAQKNFDIVKDHAEYVDDYEVLEMLDVVEYLNMKHIFENKEQK